MSRISMSRISMSRSSISDVRSVTRRQPNTVLEKETMMSRLKGGTGSRERERVFDIDQMGRKDGGEKVESAVFSSLKMLRKILRERNLWSRINMSRSSMTDVRCVTRRQPNPVVLNLVCLPSLSSLLEFTIVLLLYKHLIK